MSSPLQAIKAKCIECSGGSKKEAKLCPCTDCPLWPFRLGKRPQKANDEGFIEFKPRKKPGAVWGIRTPNWNKSVYVIAQDIHFVVGANLFAKTEYGLELAKQKAREEIKHGMES